MKISSIPKLGDKSEDVKSLQNALNNNIVPFLPLLVDGQFGSKTLEAVKKVQKKLGMDGTGTIGPKTLQALDLEIGQVYKNTATITKDLKGKKDRHLHPVLRKRIEEVVFFGGVVPLAWYKRDNTNLRALEVLNALAGMNIREVGGNNMGEDVGYIQGTTGPYTPGGNGDAWCEDVQQIPVAFLEDFFEVESPVLASPNVKAVWEGAVMVPGLTTFDCELGTQATGNYPGTTKGHAMGVTQVLSGGKMATVEGNTGDASMNDGDVLTRKIRNQAENGKLRTMGFVRQFPNNVAPARA